MHKQRESRQRAAVVPGYNNLINLPEISQDMSKQKDPAYAFLQATGEKIRSVRKKKGFSLEKMGLEIGLDKGNMHHIESGKNITLATLHKIALVLDTEAGKLLGANKSRQPVKKAARKPVRRKKSR